MPEHFLDVASEIPTTTTTKTNTAETVAQHPEPEILAILRNTHDPTEVAAIESSSTATIHIPTTFSPVVIREFKKIVLEDHHYLEAIYYIGLIMLIFSMTGLVLVGILFFYINRRKRFNVHHNSSAIPLHYL